MADNQKTEFDLVVLGAGPGGYTAAFRAADLGLKVGLIERDPYLGGVCLNVGCIPSKALLHVAEVINESAHAKSLGLEFAKPKIDLNAIRSWKSALVKKLTSGLSGLANKRKVVVIHGEGEFTDANNIKVGNKKIKFKQAIIAVGSKPFAPPGLKIKPPLVMDSTAALELADIPKNLLIVGGGIIGLEMATVYHALGSKISIVEATDSLMPGTDADLVRPLARKLSKIYEKIYLSTTLVEMKTANAKVVVQFDDKDKTKTAFDKVLIAAGRSPNGNTINAQSAGVNVDQRGFIKVNNQQRTNIPNIFAIGDVVGQPMLAHKATHEAKVAAEVAAGMKSGFEARVIPAVAYTDPEIAWVGITEEQAKQNKIQYGKGGFPWAASGRALSQDNSEGVTKLLFDEQTARIIGAGITGKHAGELIGEAAVAIEMNATATDLALTVHPHPTLIETLGFAAEMFEGSITDLYAPKKKI